MAITLVLAVFGLVMVLSSSSVEAAGDGGSPFGDFVRQGLAELFGVVAMLAASRVPRTLWLRLAPWVLAAAVGVQLLTVLTPLGVERGGNRNWIQVGPLSVQPSEFVKFALVLAVATFFTRRSPRRLGLRGLVPVLLLGTVAIVPVGLGRDMGTCIIIADVLLAGLLFAEVRWRVILAVLLPLVGAAAAMVVIAGSRVERIAAWAGGCRADLLDSCWQTQQGTWALAAGGLLGSGIGHSVSKWFWLPEADNDFIVAIIGEETGLVGLALLLGLFVALAVAFLRIVTGSRDRFTRVAAGMALAWIVGQALVNIAVVLGFLPVLGVPLPFVSSGGSSMVANLLVVGLVLSLVAAKGARQGADGQVEEPTDDSAPGIGPGAARAARPATAGVP